MGYLIKEKELKFSYIILQNILFIVIICAISIQLIQFLVG